MGVKNLGKLIKKYAPNAIKQKKLKKYKGVTVSIDASLIIYQFVLGIRNNGSDLKNANGKLTSHLIAITTKVINLLEFGIKPTFVFDGKPPAIKDGVIKKRKNDKKKALKEIEEVTACEDMDSMDKMKIKKKASLKTFKLTTEQVDECKKLLKLMGIPYFHAPSEADPQCVEFAKQEMVYGVATEDMDTLMLGSPIMLRGFSPRKEYVEEIRLKRVLKELEFTYKQFVDLCILLGTDYCPTIKGVGMVKAYTLIQEHGSIKNLLAKLEDDEKLAKKLVLPCNYKEQYKATKKYVKNPPLLEDPVIEFKKPKKNKIISYLVEFGFNEKNTTKKIERYIELYEKYVNSEEDT